MSQSELTQIYNEANQLLQDSLEANQQTTEFSLHLAQQQFEQLQAFKDQLQQQRQQQRELEYTVQRTHKLVTGLFVIGLATLIIGLSAFGWLTYQIHQQHQQDQQATEFTSLAPIANYEQQALGLDQEMLSQKINDLLALQNTQHDAAFNQIAAQLEQYFQALKAQINQTQQHLNALQTASNDPNPTMDITPLTTQVQSLKQTLQRLQSSLTALHNDVRTHSTANREYQQQLTQRIVALESDLETKFHELQQALTERPVKGDYIYRNPQQFNP
jgi:ElaB/YqjD/DUF883 family membrane-anchored ribosome-binding protein